MELLQPNSARSWRQGPHCQNRCPYFRLLWACAEAFPKADTTAASRRRHSEPLLRPIFQSLHPPKGPASSRHHTCKAEDNNTKHWILGSYPSRTRKCLRLRKILYFVAIFFSKVASATRSFS